MPNHERPRRERALSVYPEAVSEPEASEPINAVSEPEASEPINAASEPEASEPINAATLFPGRPQELAAR